MVDRVTIGVTRFAFENKLRTPAENLTTANFSARYCAAMALSHPMPPVYESPLLLRLWPEAYKDAGIVSLQQRIDEIVDEDLDRRNPYSVDTTVAIRLKDGRELCRTTAWVKDAPSHGTIWLQELTDAQVEAKFRNLAGEGIAPEQVEGLVGAIRNIEQVTDVRELARLARRGEVREPVSRHR